MSEKISSLANERRKTSDGVVEGDLIMKNKNLFFSAMLLGVFVTSGCVSKETKESLNEKVAVESKVNSKAEFQDELQKSIENANNLTPAQKEQLLALRDQTHAKMASYQEECLKLKSVLIKDIISPNYNEAEVRLIKSRLRKLETRRLNSMFETIEQANKIMGREAMHNEAILQSMYSNGAPPYKVQ
jgi:hypothetical protein